jgi:hypothetical protein
VARFVWPVLIAVAVVVALIVSASGEETREEIEYLEAIDAQAAEIAKGGDALRDVVSRLQRIGRVEFVTVIDGIREDLAVGLEYVEGDPPTASVIPVRAQYRVALQNWDFGIAEFGAAVLEAADNPDSIVVIDHMANALAEIRAGDSNYASLVVDMRRADVPNALTEFPQVVLSPAEGSLVGLSAVYIDSARSPNNTLALRPGLAVSQLVSDPEWQVNPSDLVVVPTTESIVFSVVITNAGNVASKPETVLLSLDGGPEPIRIQAEVDVLQPNQQVTVTFEAVPVEPGGVYEVSARLVVTDDDANAQDNTIAVQFSVNEG